MARRAPDIKQRFLVGDIWKPKVNPAYDYDALHRRGVNFGWVSQHPARWKVKLIAGGWQVSGFNGENIITCHFSYADDESFIFVVVCYEVDHPIVVRSRRLKQPSADQILSIINDAIEEEML